jgi:hypothetical protein
MDGLLRRLRGLAGIGLTWGVLWVMFGVALVLALRAFDPAQAGEGALTVGRVLGFAGFVSGISFGTLLTVAERRRNLRNLSAWRAGLWGAIGAAVIPLLTAADDKMLILTCPLGFLFATTSIILARRAELRDAGRTPIQVLAPR